MSENENTSPEAAAEELVALKERADIMGITYHPNIGLAKLREKVNAKLTGEPAEPESENSPEPSYAAEEAATIEAADGQYIQAAPQRETAAQRSERRKKDALRLVRIRITDMNPINGNLKGVLMCAGNGKIGMQKKFIPFNAENGWHVPNIIVEQLKQKKFMSHFEVKIDGKRVKRHRLVPQYAIEILPPLTPAELQELKQRQLMAQGQ